MQRGYLYASCINKNLLFTHNYNIYDKLSDRTRYTYLWWFYEQYGCGVRWGLKIFSTKGVFGGITVVKVPNLSITPLYIYNASACIRMNPVHWLISRVQYCKPCDQIFVIPMEMNCGYEIVVAGVSVRPQVESGRRLYAWFCSHGAVDLNGLFQNHDFVWFYFSRGAGKLSALWYMPTYLESILM